MKRTDSAVVAGLLVTAAIATDGCASRDVTADARSPTAVRLVSVDASSSAAFVTYSAVIAPNAQVDLAFRVSGYVVDIHRSQGADGRTRGLEPGATIARALVLARVRATDYQVVVDRARSARDESSTGVIAADAALAEAQAGLTEAASDFERISALWQQESVTKPVYDGATARRDAARAKVDAAIAARAAATQRATAAAAQAHEAEIALSDTALRAPFDGILLERHVEVGTLVTPATPAFTIADLRLIKARFSVPDTALPMFRAGQVLPVSVDALVDERFQGHVLSVAPAADPKSRSFEITVAIDNPTYKLRSGMIASIRVAGETAEPQRLLIPIDALVHDPVRDRYLVYALEQKDGRSVAKTIDITPGPLVGNHVSILEGLTAGQRIVASGANLLRPGDVVKEIQ